MTQTERRLYLIQYLLGENTQYADVKIPTDVVSQKQLLRALMNVRPAIPASDEFLAVQNAYLREVNQARGITKLSDLSPKINHNTGDIYLWRGDITTLCVDGIVNAANSGLTGCWQPCHACRVIMDYFSVASLVIRKLTITRRKFVPCMMRKRI